MKTKITVLLFLAAAGCSEDLVCDSSKIACGGKCVALLTDPANCGACGVACAANERCNAGTCVLCGPGECAPPDAYVACYATLEVIPVTAGLDAGAPRSTPSSPASLAILGAAVYSANGSPQASVSVIPLDASLPVRTPVTFTGSDLEHIAAHDNVLLVTNAATGTLVVLSPSGDVLGEIPMPGQQSGPNPHGFDAMDTTAYVALYGSGPDSGQAIAKVDLSGIPTCAAASGPCGSIAASIDLRATPGASDAPGLPFPSEVLMTGGKAYVTLANLTLGDNSWDSAYYVKPAGNGKLAVITPGAPDTLVIVDLGASCGNPGALALHGTNLWIACGSFSYSTVAPSVLLPVDLSTSPPVPGVALAVPAIIPGKLAFCGGIGYVTDQGSGQVVRFDPVARTVEEPVVICPTSAGEFGWAWAADIVCTE